MHAIPSADAQSTSEVQFCVHHPRKQLPDAQLGPVAHGAPS